MLDNKNTFHNDYLLTYDDSKRPFKLSTIKGDDVYVCEEDSRWIEIISVGSKFLIFRDRDHFSSKWYLLFLKSNILYSLNKDVDNENFYCSLDPSDEYIVHAELKESRIILKIAEPSGKIVRRTSIVPSDPDYAGIEVNRRNNYIYVYLKSYKRKSLIILNAFLELIKIVEPDLGCTTEVFFYKDRFKIKMRDRSAIRYISQCGGAVDRFLMFNEDIPILVDKKLSKKYRGAIIISYPVYGRINFPKFDLLNYIARISGYDIVSIHGRGSGDLGSSWHFEGSKKNRDRCLTDFIDSVEYYKKKFGKDNCKYIYCGESAGAAIAVSSVNYKPGVFTDYFLSHPSLNIYKSFLFKRPLSKTDISEWWTGTLSDLLVYSPAEWEGNENLKSIENVVIIASKYDYKSDHSDIIKFVSILPRGSVKLFSSERKAHTGGSILNTIKFLREYIFTLFSTRGRFIEGS